MRQQILKELIGSIDHKAAHKKLARQELFLKNSLIIDQQIKKLKSEINKLKLEQQKKIAELIKTRRF